MNQESLGDLIHQHRHLLTDREKFVVHFTASGWSSRRIAHQLGISHTTVLADLDHAMNTIRKAAA